MFTVVIWQSMDDGTLFIMGPRLLFSYKYCRIIYFYFIMLCLYHLLLCGTVSDCTVVAVVGSIPTHISTHASFSNILKFGRQRGIGVSYQVLSVYHTIWKKNVIIQCTVATYLLFYSILLYVKVFFVLKLTQTKR